MVTSKLCLIFTSQATNQNARKPLFTKEIILKLIIYAIPVYLDFLQVAKKKLQLAVCGSNLPTLLELVKSHNTC